ncbi:hypothetical protein ACJMK2_007378 [Sinanodonta woodiana]|uniref:NHR domain-containing protein n=1 Tax=Sinanodonta woodiana TaxID=1069815 RepID=A0ABD3VIK6_SINWO
MANSLRFHNRTGTLVTLSDDNRTAQRNYPTQEFNNGVILSNDTLKDNQIFEVKIDKKVNSWSGSIEIGVTTCDPDSLIFPISATGFREGTWVMSGSSVLKDGHSMIEEYGADLDQLSEGDRVGVMRTAEGELHFFVNGADQGVAASEIPQAVYAVVDMYGKCAQVSIIDPDSTDNRNTVNVLSNEVAHQLANEFLVQLSNHIVNDLATRTTEPVITLDEPIESQNNSNDRLQFHERCGTLVKLSNNHLTAERRRPLDEFNNGVVMTNRPLKNDELFELRLDRLVDKWSGSIEVGVTTHNPSLLDFPATMTNMRSGTIMMSGCGILTNGKGTRREYGQYNLDALAEGDRIGLIRKSSGVLHYYINGHDQGVAATNTPPIVWGVVDLYGMAVKVTILDQNDPGYPGNCRPSLPLERSNIFRQYPDMYDDNFEELAETDRLQFHLRCGSHAAVINNSKTAHRPNALDDFNNGVVLTSRPLHPSELFEVRIDKMVDKWAGSIEIGLTLHSPETLDFPSTMTNIRSGTWMMTGNGVMHNGTTVMDEYGLNLDVLKAGDRVGVLRKPDGTVHFFVNGVDQGVAARNVPEDVYGVIDLYGQAAQATILYPSDSLSTPEVDMSSSVDLDLLRFHSLHGTNASLLNNGRTAIRPNATGEFNDAIIMSNRPLKDNELFEFVIEKMVDRWSGSIEAGVTLIKPEELDFPNTMTDIEHDTWMLSGSAIMQDGSTMRNGYALDLDAIIIGSRIGMMRCSDGTLHFYHNGVDQGMACSDIPPGVYAVVDLYGQCAQVSITSGSGVLPPTENNPLQNQNQDLDHSTSSHLNTEVTHRFSQCAGKNILIKNNGCMATRFRNFNHGLIFSSDPLKKDEIFEVRVEQLSHQWSGSLRIGLTSMAISDTTPVSLIPLSSIDLTLKTTWIVTGSEVKRSGVVIKENYAASLERIEVGTRVGVQRSHDGTMHIYINGEDMGIAASNIPKNVFAVIDLFGMVDSVSVVSNAVMGTESTVSTPTDDSELICHTEVDSDQDKDTSAASCLQFNSNHGKNIMLCNGRLTAERAASYNQGVVVSCQKLNKNRLFQIRLDQLNPRWSSSLMVGVLSFPPDRFNFPVSALAIKKSCIVVQGDAVYVCGAKIKEHYGPNLDKLHRGHMVGVLVDEENAMHLYVNGVDQGIAMREVSQPCYAIIDLYGQCEKVTIMPEEINAVLQPAPVVMEDREKADLDDVVKEKQQQQQSRSSDVSVIVRNCEYLNICNRIKSQLALPDSYFDPQLNMCFCETCHKIRGDETYIRKGDPPREFAVPFGWCKFMLRISSKAHVLNVAEKWHVGYYGCHMEALRRILDSCDLHSPGETVSGGSLLLPQAPLFTEKTQPDVCAVNPISLSPTLRYAGCNEFAPKNKVIDPKTKKTYYARVAIQAWVKPGSYKIGPQSIQANEPIDPRFSNNELEWSTKERGSTMIQALLIKIE